MERQGGNANAYNYVKETNVKMYRLYEFNYVTFWKRKNYGDSQKFSGCQVLRRRME